ncbi:hypothetical protein OHC33_004634 [Knufia fluminis]|uniref:Uncharacterized protein n=1 Tax=Knufia fluminis TaxID=191047 RepID=A0AAN8EF01_9EURO|nr:hypothetical protein OHC33_004634 [Knufia fluminis]
MVACLTDNDASTPRSLLAPLGCGHNGTPIAKPLKSQPRATLTDLPAEILEVIAWLSLNPWLPLVNKGVFSKLGHLKQMRFDMLVVLLCEWLPAASLEIEYLPKSASASNVHANLVATAQILFAPSQPAPSARAAGQQATPSLFGNQSATPAYPPGLPPQPVLPFIQTYGVVGDLPLLNLRTPVIRTATPFLRRPEREHLRAQFSEQTWCTTTYLRAAADQVRQSWLDHYWSPDDFEGQHLTNFKLLRANNLPPQFGTSFPTIHTKDGNHYLYISGRYNINVTCRAAGAGPHCSTLKFCNQDLFHRVSLTPTLPLLPRRVLLAPNDDTKEAAINFYNTDRPSVTRSFLIDPLWQKTLRYTPGTDTAIVAAINDNATSILQLLLQPVCALFGRFSSDPYVVSPQELVTYIANSGHWSIARAMVYGLVDVDLGSRVKGPAAMDDMFKALLLMMAGEAAERGDRRAARMLGWWVGEEGGEEQRALGQTVRPAVRRYLTPYEIRVEEQQEVRDWHDRKAYALSEANTKVCWKLYQIEMMTARMGRMKSVLEPERYVRQPAMRRRYGGSQGHGDAEFGGRRWQYQEARIYGLTMAVR